MPEVGTLTENIKQALREAFSPALFGGEEVNDRMQLLLGHRIKRSDLVIKDPRELTGWGHNNSADSCGELVDSLLIGTDLNYVGHRACVRKASEGEKK